MCSFILVLHHERCYLAVAEEMRTPRIASAPAWLEALSRLSKRKNDMLGTILIIVVILMLVGANPRWPHSREWGYYPSGGLGVVLVLLVVLLLLGRI
jgi:uncharacterized membrane protein YkgB